MGKALKGRRDRVFLMTKCCAHKRGQTKKSRPGNARGSLTRLQTDRLDLWSWHQLTTMDESTPPLRRPVPWQGFRGEEQGKVRYLGFTGHQSAEVHLAMLNHDFPFDAVLMPVNAFEPNRKGFRTEVLRCAKRELGVLGSNPRRHAGQGAPRW